MVKHGQLYIDESHLHGRHETIHVVASVAVVAEQQLIIVLAGPAQAAGLALDALPGILLHTDQHVLGELEAGGVTWRSDISIFRI